jgi:signal transduction histidine kinase
LWTDATGPLLLSAIHTNQRTEEAQGVLVLSFTGTDDPQQAQRPYEIEQNDTIRICTILLSNYLYSSNPAEAPAPDTNVEATPTTSTHPRQPTDPWFVTPTPMDALATLYELTLAISSRLSQQELYQHILTHMANVIDAPGACLLRHDPDQQQFHIVAAQGQQLPEQALLDALDSTELQRLALRGPGQNYVDLFIVGQRVALITLSCNCTLLGALALPLLPNTEQPATHITLLTYMGNVAALLLHNYDTQQAEYKALLDRERNRIARDIHDGVAQHIAHALHKLELIQRLLENQQCTQVRCEVQRAYSQVEDSLYKLRQCVASLRPLELENHTFTDALNALLAEYKSSYPEVRIISDVHALGQLPARLETPIFRLIQEACNNVYKHAHATHIILRLYIFSGLLIIEVQDDGIGMQEVQEEQTSSEQHMGLRAMKERVHEVGGYWELHSSPDSGTLVKAHFPLQGAVATLTNRERDILRLLIEGMTNRAIAERLSISQDTVKSHIHHIIQKMRVRDRTQAAVVATRQGWL